MTERAQRLLAKAAELKLTEKQRRFAEALARDPEENQTRAAEVAGLGKPWAVQGAKMVKLGKVRAYIAAIHAEAGLTAVRADGAESAIASREEVLRAITEDMRSDIADVVHINADRSWDIDVAGAIASGKSRIIRELGYDSQGRPRVKLVDPQKAKDQLARFHGIYADEARNQETTLGELVKALDAATRLAMAKALLRGHSNGNGNGHVVVEGEARRVG